MKLFSYLAAFVQFIQKDISDTKPTLLDNAIRLLSQLMVQWRSTMAMAGAISQRVSGASIKWEKRKNIMAFIIVSFEACL